LEIHVLNEKRLKLGESPVWDNERGLLLYVDIIAGHIFEYNPCNNTTKTVKFGEKTAYAAPNSEGGLIIAAESGIYKYSQITKIRNLLSKPEKHLPENRFNDGCVDQKGRLWISSIHDIDGVRERLGQIYRFNGSNGLVRYFDHYFTPNGLAFSPCNKQMFFSDTNSSVQKIWISDYDLDQGHPSGSKLLFDCNQIRGRPDGATTDTAGCYWFAAYDGAQIIRLTPAGKVDKSIKLPLRYPTKLAFGGKDLKTLYVTSASPAQQAKAQESIDGQLLAITNSGAQGIPQRPFNANN
jgi:L-arabinonolactonase